MDDGTIAECIEVAQEEIQENNEIRQRNPTDINIQQETGDKLDRLHRYVNALQRFHSNQDIQDFINTMIRSNTSTECPICYDSYYPDKNGPSEDVCICIPCGHMFHCNCLDNLWSSLREREKEERTRGNIYVLENKCPMCNMRICYHDTVELPPLPQTSFGNNGLLKKIKLNKNDIKYLGRL